MKVGHPLKAKPFYLFFYLPLLVAVLTALGYLVVNAALTLLLQGFFSLSLVAVYFISSLPFVSAMHEFTWKIHELASHLRSSGGWKHLLILFAGGFIISLALPKLLVIASAMAGLFLSNKLFAKVKILEHKLLSALHEAKTKVKIVGK